VGFPARLLVTLLGIVTAAAPPRAFAEERRPAEPEANPGDAGATDAPKKKEPGTDDSRRGREPAIRAADAQPERPRSSEAPSPHATPPPDPGPRPAALALHPSPPPPPRIDRCDTRAGRRGTPPPADASLASGR